MKKVYTAKNPADAHLLKGLLEGENIEAEVRGEFLYGVRGEVPITQDTCPSVWVMDDSDYDRAMKLVSTFREGECLSCGNARPMMPNVRRIYPNEQGNNG